MKKILYFIAATLFLVACNKEQGIAPGPQDILANSVKINIVDFVDADETKASVSTEGVFSWATSDRIGVWPLTVDPAQDPQQLYFDWSSGGDTGASAVFAGSGWGMFCTGDYTYSSYFPYVNSGSKTAVPFTYPANLSETNGTIAAVNRYLPMYSPAITPDAPEECSFVFYQLSALARFVLTAPQGVQYTKVVIKTADESNVFTTAGTYDLTSATALAAPTITPTTQVNAIGFSTNATLSVGTPDLVLWMSMCPAALNGKTLNISMWDSENNKYTGSVACTRDQQSGKRYRYAATLTLDAVDPYDAEFIAGIEAVDLGHSTLLFAPFNLGATSIEETGDFFAFGEIATKSTFTSDNYVGPQYDLIGSSKLLDARDDAAAVLWGNGWKMPEYDQINAFLQDQCDKEWVTINGTQGWKCYNKNNHEKWIFLPSGGYKTTSVFDTELGYYWTKTHGTGGGNNQALYELSRQTSPRSMGNYGSIYRGMSIRPVKNK